jgi:hypothetical protein
MPSKIAEEITIPLLTNKGTRIILRTHMGQLVHTVLILAVYLIQYTQLAFVVITQFAQIGQLAIKTAMGIAYIMIALEHAEEMQFLILKMFAVEIVGILWLAEKTAMGIAFILRVTGLVFLLLQTLFAFLMLKA